MQSSIDKEIAAEQKAMSDEYYGYDKQIFVYKDPNKNSPGVNGFVINIKTFRTMLNCGLKDAKDFHDAYNQKQFGETVSALVIREHLRSFFDKAHKPHFECVAYDVINKYFDQIDGSTYTNPAADRYGQVAYNALTFKEACTKMLALFPYFVEETGYEPDDQEELKKMIEEIEKKFPKAMDVVVRREVRNF